MGLLLTVDGGYIVTKGISFRLRGNRKTRSKVNGKEDLKVVGLKITETNEKRPKRGSRCREGT